MLLINHVFAIDFNFLKKFEINWKNWLINIKSWLIKRKAWLIIEHEQSNEIGIVQSVSRVTDE